MVLVILVVFAGVFVAVSLVIVAASSKGTRKNKQVLAKLDAAILPAAKEKPVKVINFRRQQLLSAMPWLNRLLAKIDIVPRLEALLKQAEVKWTVGVLLLLCVAGFAIPGYLVNLSTGSTIIGLLVGAVTGVAPLGYVRFMRGIRFGKFEKELPDALELMVSALRVGHSFTSALALVARECPAPLGTEFRICFEEQNFGLDVRTSLENLVARVPLQDLCMTVTAILIQRESGGNLAEVLDKTADVIRQRFRLKKQVMVHTAQGRLTGMILALLPMALGVGLYLVSPATMSILWKRPIGVKLLWGAGAMMATGMGIIQKIVHMEV